jgi:hypothetical protein
VLYEAIGANLAAGNGYSADVGPPFRPEITRTPVLPALIAATYSFTGRKPGVILWLNAVFVGAAVSMGYLVLLRLSGRPAAALTGAVLALLAPFIPGAAATINTEALAMLQVAAAALWLTRWQVVRARRHEIAEGAVFGLLLASLVLNRVNFLPAVLAAAVFVVVWTLRQRWRPRAAWLTALALGAGLSAPILLWAARNASVGLPFSPAPTGLYASRVHDLMRYREAVFQGHPPPPPGPNVRYFQNWRERYGPEALLRLEAQNKAWFRQFYTESGDRLLAATPARFVGLFSSSTVASYPIRDPEGLRFPGPLLRWASRGLWVLSLLGALALWRFPLARGLWFVPLLTLVPIHLGTVCASRYMTALMPLLFPYGGAALVALSSPRGRARALASPIEVIVA